MPLKYNKIAILLHWTIAIAIFMQLGSGIWMVSAIENKETVKKAFLFYQFHKSSGLTILVLSFFRLFWRIKHTAPELPLDVRKMERIAASISHKLLYVFMIFIPLLGWIMVSTSPYGFPTMIFSIFEWPHISYLTDLGNKLEINKLATSYHKYMAYSMLALLFLHIAGALKHQFIEKNNIFSRILP